MGKKLVKVSVDKLVLDPDNPNRHTERNLTAIEKSLKRFEQVEPLVVQKNTLRVIAGNGRLNRMLKLGIKEADVILVDVDDATAREMALVFNRTGQMAELDNKAVAKILSEAANSGSKFDDFGYTETEYNSILSLIEKKKWKPVKEVEDEEVEVFSGLPSPTTESSRRIEPIKGDGTVHSANDGSDTREEYEELAEEATDVHDFKEYVEFPSNEVFDIPPLRPDMLADCPWDDLVTYTGSDKIGVPVQEPGNHHFIIHGTYHDPPSWEKSILGFYIWDDKFDDAWIDPATFVKKLLRWKVYAAVAPNFTPHGPMAQRIYSIYQRAWCARYWQECGLKVIPDVHLGVRGDQWKFYLAGIPKNAPCICAQVQTGADIHIDNMNRIIKLLEPKKFILYGGAGSNKINKMMETLDAGDTKVILLETFTSRRMSLRGKTKNVENQKPTTKRKKKKGT